MYIREPPWQRWACSHTLSAQGNNVAEVKAPILKGTRWNTLYDQVITNRSMQRETLLFQARYLCDPPFEKEKELDLLRILEKREEEQAGEGKGTAELDLELDAHVGTLLADRFKDTWAYLLPDSGMNIKNKGGIAHPDGLTKCSIG